jgi:hypothetical protein
VSLGLYIVDIGGEILHWWHNASKKGKENLFWSQFWVRFNWRPTLGFSFGFRFEVHSFGQSELTATNAPVGRSVHWMGCVFSFGARWGSSQSNSFCCGPLYFFIYFLVLGRFSWT